MGKIFYIMGKSSSGKDTIYKKLLIELNKLAKFRLEEFIIYTTRPMRIGEKNGEEYHFVNEKKWRELDKEGRIIESRTYNRVNDTVKYFTVDDENININKNSYMGIGTLQSYEKMCKYYGQDLMVPIYIEVDDKTRLLRAIDRECEQAKENKNYKEVCRRFIADEEDFSKEKLDSANINKKFQNDNIDDCLDEILEYIGVSYANI